MAKKKIVLQGPAPTLRETAKRMGVTPKRTAELIEFFSASETKGGAIRVIAHMNKRTQRKRALRGG